MCINHLDESIRWIRDELVSYVDESVADEICGNIVVGIQPHIIPFNFEAHSLCNIGNFVHSKNEKYGGAYDKMYRQFGSTYFESKIYEKLERYHVMINEEDCEESVVDSLVDMIGYCIREISRLVEIGYEFKYI
jgi:hypothetical protein